MVLEEVGIQARGVDFDTMIAAALTGRRAIGLKQLALDFFHVEMTPITDLIGTGRKQITMAETAVEQAADYAAADADLTWRLREHLTPHIESENQQAMMNEIEMPLLPVIVRMQRNGILVDRSALAEMSEELGGELVSIENHARNEVMAGREFNLKSNQQLAAILIDELGAPQDPQNKNRLLDGRQRPRGNAAKGGPRPSRIRTRPRCPAVQRVVETQVHLRRRSPADDQPSNRARAHLIQPGSARPRAGFQAPTRMCRTYPSARSSAGVSARRSWQTKRMAGRSWRPTIRRSNCASLLTCHASQACWRHSGLARTSTTQRRGPCMTRTR